MSNIKKLSNQSNADIIIPNENNIKKMGFDITNFDILSNYSRKAYSFESEHKYPIIDKIFKKDDIIYIPEINPGIIRIASYNVHNFVSVYSGYERKRNIDNFIKFFKNLNAHCVCLQEVSPVFEKELKDNIKFSNSNKYNFKLVVKKMNEIGYKYSSISNYIVNETFFDKNNSSYYVLANAIFSKQKFESEIFYLSGNRSAISAYFSNKDFNYIVINTHLEYTNKFFDSELLKQKFGLDDIRKIQVKELLEICNNVSRKYNTENIFITGDFNDEYNSYLLKDIFAKFTSIRLFQKTNLSRNLITDYITPSKKMMRNIFIYNYDIVNAKLSDHLPIYLDFIPNIDSNKNIIQKLSIKKKIIKLDKNSINSSYIDEIFINSNSVSKYIEFKLSDKIVDQYYLDVKQWYYGKVEPMFKVKDYDYVSLVKNLISINNFYEKYEIIANEFNGKMIKITKKMEKNRLYIEDMLLQFIKCRPEMKIITIWPAINFNSHIKEFGDILQENGNIYYKKEIAINFDEAMSLMYQIYINTDRNKTESHLKYNVIQKGWDENNKNNKKRVIIIFYEYTSKNSQISGSQSEFKTKLRSFWKTDEIRPYDILHINDFFQETIDYATIYLNNNSIEFLGKQDIYNFLRINQYNEQVYINTLKKTLYQNFNQNEILRFIFFSSIVLFAYGIRKFNDIDGFIYPSDKKNISFDKKYNEFFDITSNSFINFIDISYPDSKAYQDYILQFLDKIGYIFDKVKYRDIIFDPKYHFYFFGIKMHKIELEIIKRIYRFKPAAWADLVIIKEKLGYPIVFPKIPDNIKHYYKNAVVQKTLIETIIFYLNKKYGIRKKKSDIEGLISDKEITSDIYNKNINKDIQFFSNILK